MDRGEPEFGLWCAMAVELLARSTLSYISPTLLAETDPEHRHLLHALGRGSNSVAKRSIGTVQALNLCKTLVPNFSDDDYRACIAMVGRRNEELHTGAIAFAEYAASQWQAGVYKACEVLCQSMSKTLEDLLGKAEARAAKAIIKGADKDVAQRVNSLIAAHAKVFQAKPSTERSELKASAAKRVKLLVVRRHHKVICPSCKCDATILGSPFGASTVTVGPKMIVEKQPVLPKSFKCASCGLSLGTYSQLQAARLGAQYTRTTTYTPAQYYSEIKPDEFDWESLSAAEYDNG